KMDLTQAEAVMDLIEAQTDLALRAAHGQLSGRFGGQLLEVRRELLATLGHLEAHIDFPDEGLSPDTATQLAERVAGVARTLSDLAATAEMGRFLRDGVKTVICGEPNVGKSSLLNHLLGFDRAIVSERAGTTRDTIEEVIDIGGFPVRLIDTAGLRVSDDEIERAGIARTEEKIGLADFVIEVVDASREQGERVADRGDGVRRLLILNKSDLGEEPGWVDAAGLRVSCKSGAGLDGLIGAIAEQLVEGQADAAQDSLVAVSVRHRHCLEAAVGALDAVIGGISAGAELELVAIDLRSAMDSLGEIVGKVDSEELLGEIFGSFCVGK
ncbi:MAG: tRNA modification GTPase, partial [Verrucomicrobiales bacterium]|nr:tRNA modification GTPase [Verrucomicrobiales bacterium]